MIVISTQRLPLLLMLLVTVSTAFSMLETTPAHVDDVLTAYHGDPISLTCSHNNPATAVTKWLFTPPVDCARAIDHNPPITVSACGPFTFVNVTELSCCQLNSTAIATATTSMTGTIVECRDSAGISFNVLGRITLCIIDLPQPPSNISWHAETASIVWNPASQEACSVKDLSYFVTIIPLPPNYRTFSTEVNNISLSFESIQFNTSYIVLVSTQIKADQLQSGTVSTYMFTTDQGDMATSSEISTTSNSLPSGLTIHTSTMPSVVCSCDNVGINSSTSTCTPSALIVAVSVPMVIFLTICIGLIVGSLITYCFMKSNTSSTAECDSTIPQRPIYEEISVSNILHSENFKLEENVAYGPVGEP